MSINVGGMQPVKNKNRGSSLADVVEIVLDKGLVINADILVSVAGVELLGIKIRAALASFETAAKYGLDFPSGTDIETQAWQEAQIEKEVCPECGKKVKRKILLNKMCPWCGWISAAAKSRPELEGPKEKIEASVAPEVN